MGRGGEEAERGGQMRLYNFRIIKSFKLNANLFKFIKLTTKVKF